MGYPLRGEIWVVDLHPTRGSEIRKKRPCLVLSNNVQNKNSQALSVIPISSSELKYPMLQFSVDEKLSGLKKASHLEISQLRAADKSRFSKKLGIITPELFEELYMKLNLYLGFVDLME